MKDDHDRGCQGRSYSCTCGYDEQRDARMAKALSVCRTIKVALDQRVPVQPDSGIHEKLRELIR